MVCDVFDFDSYCSLMNDACDAISNQQSAISDHTTTIETCNSKKRITTYRTRSQYQQLPSCTRDDDGCTQERPKLF